MATFFLMLHRLRYAYYAHLWHVSIYTLAIVSAPGTNHSWMVECLLSIIATVNQCQRSSIRHYTACMHGCVAAMVHAHSMPGKQFNTDAPNL